MFAVEVQGLYKQFGPQTVLQDVSFQLESGKIHGLVGDNGSGKSVLLKCLCGILPWERGMIRIQGKEMHPGKGTPPLLGLVIEHPGFIGSMSGWRNLKYLAGIRGIAGDAQIKASLEQVGLLHEAKKPVKKYSLGMRQKLAIAQALMEAPDIYFMDEPFNGLDKTSTAAIQKLFMELRAQGKTFLLVSHHPSDISSLCDDVYAMENGGISRKE